MLTLDGVPAVGFVNVGGAIFQRRELAAVLPDIARFERCMDEALAAHAYMAEHGGAVPPSARRWDEATVQAIAETMREIAALQRCAADEIERERGKRGVLQ